MTFTTWLLQGGAYSLAACAVVGDVHLVVMP